MSDSLDTRLRDGLLCEHAYESALGRMLVRFNDLEAMLGQILEGALDKLGVGHLYKVNDFYAQKLDRLELAMCALPDWPKQDWARLRQINQWRNTVAHGHFTQDPNTAAYGTRSVHKKGWTLTGITPEQLDDWTLAAINAEAQLGGLLPYVWFDDIPTELPPGASMVPFPEK